MVALGALIVVVRPWRGSPPRPTPEDEEQKKIDAEQRQREDQKAAQLRNDPFLVRKEDESQRQLNSLLKELNLGKDPGADLPTPLSDRQARAEEEAIAGILRKQDPVTAHSDPPYVPRRSAVQTSQTAGSADKDAGPMFVYSRTFGGAKYVDTPQKQTAPRLEPGSGEKHVDSSPRMTKNIVPEAQT